VVARSTAPVKPARRASDQVEAAALAIRAQLTRDGWDAGPLSVADKMRQMGMVPPSRATLARIFSRNGVVKPEPTKRPRASYVRFRYPDPNGCWQLDGFEYTLDSGITRCILQVEDDHSRVVLASHVAPAETSDAAIAVTAEAIRRHGVPVMFLTDNGLAFNQSRRGKTSEFEAWLVRQGVTPICGRPGKPTTQGKNERLHQTLQRFLDANRPIMTTKRLIKLVNDFEDYYNRQRTHQALEPGQTPEQAYRAKAKARPAPPPPARTLKRQPVQPGAIPVSDTPGAPAWADRTADTQGNVNICHTRIRVGKHLAGRTFHILYDDNTIEVFDTDGASLGQTPRPPIPDTGLQPYLTLQPPTPNETQPSTNP